jgi:hypothetical protein
MTSHTDAARPGRISERPADTARVHQEGIAAGVLGASVIALWFLILDTLQGRPLYTPTVLGTALFKGSAALEAAPAAGANLDMVLMFTWVHFLVFAFLGGVVSRLLAVAEAAPDLGFGIILLFVVFEFGFLAAWMVFAEPVLRSVAWYSVFASNLLAAAVMAVYLRRRHPNLRIEP